MPIKCSECVEARSSKCGSRRSSSGSVTTEMVPITVIDITLITIIQFRVVVSINRPNHQYIYIWLNIYVSFSSSHFLYYFILHTHTPKQSTSIVWYIILGVRREGKSEKEKHKKRERNKSENRS